MYANSRKPSPYDKISTAIDYFHNINRKWFKLDVYFISVPCGEQTVFKRNAGICLAHYTPITYSDGYRAGHITLNVETLIKMDQEAINETIRHEYAHAVQDIKYNALNEPNVNPNHKYGNGHGPTWIRIAKLMRVNTKRYEF